MPLTVLSLGLLVLGVVTLYIVWHLPDRSGMNHPEYETPEGNKDKDG